MALGSDPIIAGQIMEMAMEKLVVMAPYIDRKDPMMRGGLAKVATGQPLAVSGSPHLFGSSSSDLHLCVFVVFCVRSECFRVKLGPTVVFLKIIG